MSDPLVALTLSSDRVKTGWPRQPDNFITTTLLSLFIYLFIERVINLQITKPDPRDPPPTRPLLSILPAESIRKVAEFIYSSPSSSCGCDSGG